MLFHQKLVFSLIISTREKRTPTMRKKTDWVEYQSFIITQGDVTVLMIYDTFSVIVSNTFLKAEFKQHFNNC